MRVSPVSVLGGLAAVVWWGLTPADPSLNHIRGNMLTLQDESHSASASGRSFTPAQVRARVEAMDWPQSSCGYRVRVMGDRSAWSVICEPYCRATMDGRAWPSWRIGHTCDMPLRMFTLSSWEATAMEAVFGAEMDEVDVQPLADL